MKKKNPYLLSYLGLTSICCLILSLAFFSIHAWNVNTMQDYFNHKKITLCLQDWEKQLELTEELALRLSINPKFQPRFFRENKYNEILLLEEFNQYGNYSVLTKNFFLYYSDSEILFRSDGQTESLDLYLKELSDTGREHFMEIISEIENTKVLSIEGKIYILVPFQFTEHMTHTSAVLFFTMDPIILGERFQIVSGGMQGTLCLYNGDELLYSNHETVCTPHQKNVLSNSTMDTLYSICYLPKEENLGQIGILFLQILLVLADVLLIFMIANIFARQSYKPLLMLSDKYRKKITTPTEKECRNALVVSSKL